MVPYFLLIILPVLVRIIGSRYRFTFGRHQLYQTSSGSMDVFMLIFMLLLALRSIEVGVDTVQYQRLFNTYSGQSVRQLWNSSDHEFGFKFLNRLVGIVGGNYQLLLTVSAVISVYPLYFFYKRESEKQLLTIALFLTVAPFVMYFSGIRQAMAMSLGIAAWYCAREKKLLRFLAVVLILIQFHRSAIIVFALYPLYHARITRRWLWFVIPCIVLIFVFRNQIFRVMLVLMWDDYGSIRETGATSILALLILLGIYSYIIPDEKNMDKDTVAMRNILLFTIAIQIFAMLHTLAMRMNYYFLIYIPILIPKIANRSQKRYKQIADLSVAVMTIFFFCYFISNGLNGSDDLSIYPYIPFWNA